MFRFAFRLAAVAAVCVAIPLAGGLGPAAAQSSAPYPPASQPYPNNAYPGPANAYPQTYPNSAYPGSGGYPQTYSNSAYPSSGNGYPATTGSIPQATDPAQPYAADAQQSDKFTVKEIVATGHNFFGQVTEGLATVVERVVARYGLPNGYILGQQASGAVVGGLRYGEGMLYTKNAGQHPIFWQGPSIGLDVGADGDRTMMLVYNLPSVDAIYSRYAGVAGSAYVVAGVGMTVLGGKGISIVPIVSGVGARLGINIGYLKFTNRPTWNPF